MYIKHVCIVSLNVHYSKRISTKPKEGVFLAKPQTSLQSPRWDYTRVYEVCGLTEKKKKKGKKKKDQLVLGKIVGMFVMCWCMNVWFSYFLDYTYEFNSSETDVLSTPYLPEGFTYKPDQVCPEKLPSMSKCRNVMFLSVLLGKHTSEALCNQFCQWVTC